MEHAEHRDDTEAERREREVNENCRDPQPQGRGTPLTEEEIRVRFEAAKARVLKNHRKNLDWLAEH